MAWVMRELSHELAAVAVEGRLLRAAPFISTHTANLQFGVYPKRELAAGVDYVQSLLCEAAMRAIDLIGEI
jgi:hypothetical protein